MASLHDALPGYVPAVLQSPRKNRRSGRRELIKEMTMKTSLVQQQDNRFIHPWEDVKHLDENQRTIISAGEGIYVTDSDGNRLIDGPAGMWCVNIGHGREEIAQAIARQAMQLSYVSPGAWAIHRPPSWRKN